MCKRIKWGEIEAYQGPLVLEKEEVVSFIVALGRQ